MDTLTALAVYLTASTSGFYVAPSASILRTSDITFNYPHPKYGILAGVIQAKDGAAYGGEVGYAWERLSIGVTGAYQSIPLKSVTVGGQPKNWGNAVDGYSVGLKATYTPFKPLYGAIGVGYQSMLGGGLYKEVEVGINKPITSNATISLSVAKRWADATTYEGLAMSETKQTILGLKLSFKF